MLIRSLRVAVIALGAAVLLTPFGASARPSTPPVINIVARQFQFTPNTITLKRGKTVVLRVTSVDVTHGFFLRPLKIDADIQPGKTTEITVTPATAGRFTLICDHFCGVNHAAMNMTVIVED